MAYTVAIVVTPNIGADLPALADRLQVWLAATPSNRAAADAYRQSHPNYSPEQGVTTFRIASTDLPDAQVLQVLDDVELHHGAHSHIPPWDGLEIYGAEPSTQLRAALAEFGVNTIEPIKGGFRCNRPAQGAA
jgi:hypothetical protein